MKNIKIKSILISNINGINELEIPFNDGCNVLCGPNGIGKTTILEAVAHSLSAGQSSILRKKSGEVSGKISASFKIDEGDEVSTNSVNEFEPNIKTQFNGLHQYSPYLLSLKISRTFPYQLLSSVSMDPDKPIHASYEEAKSGININDVKNWFVNRFLYSAHQGSMTATQLLNFEMAKKCFELVDNNISFMTILASSNEIMVQTPQGIIYYEYLSSGYKSCLSILLGVIKEIEYRFKSPDILAKDFSGIIVVDEIELHLHPEWQAKILGIFKGAFPRAQLIATTHSPHIIQHANSSEIIALERCGDQIRKREIPNLKFGFQGWTIEEVLIDVMGMSDVRTEHFSGISKGISAAIKENDIIKANKFKDDLDEILHPNSFLRKLFSIQIAGMTEEEL